MSFEFSRRSFLKYTAVAAVAVAGSSLLTGCKDNPYQPTGDIGDSLKVMGTFTLLKDPAPTYASNTLTCKMTFKCTSKRGLSVTPNCFQVEVYDKNEKSKATYRYDSTGSNVSLSNPNGNVTEGGDVLETYLYCKNMIDLTEGDIIKIKYWPRAQASQGNNAYTDAYATWEMTYTNGALK